MRFPGTFQFRSIGRRFAMAIGTGAGIILVVLAAANYFNARNLLLDQVSGEAVREARDEIGNWDDLLSKLAVLPYVIGATETAGGGGEGVTVPWLASLLEKCPYPSVYGLYMTREDRDWRDPSSDPWVDRRSWPRAARLQYDFHDPTQDWYAGPKQLGVLHVTKPYLDQGGSDIEMISITLPVYGGGGKFLGVAGVDLSLENLRKEIRELHLRDFGSSVFAENRADLPDKLREKAYLISRSGIVLFAPEEEHLDTAPVPGTPKKERPHLENTRLGEHLSPAHMQQILDRDSGLILAEEGGKHVICWARSSMTGWKLVLEIPYELIVSPARVLAWHSLLIGGTGLLLLLSMAFLVAGRVSGPIAQLQSVAETLEKGGFDRTRGALERIAARRDELGRFARSFGAMAGEIRLREERLSEWNANLEETVRQRTLDLEKANRAMAGELAEAEAYARAVLPARMPGPVGTDWIFRTCERLGGDSFGYRWLDGNTLSLYLIDVCGHGVGAALLSVSVVNMLGSGSLPGADLRDPSAVLSALNAAFPMERHNEMYFTAWYGVYDRPSGRIVYACGGHPPAVLVPPGGESLLLSATGPVVGTFPNASFSAGSAVVPGGSRLYLFSDGAYEIVKPDSTMMTFEELRGILEIPGTTPEGVLSELRRRQGNDAFADDVSLVEFRFPGGEEGP